MVTICWNFNQCRGNSTCNEKELIWTVVFQLCLWCYNGPVPQHSFHSPNKSASKLLLARAWLANWYLMCGPQGNSGSDDPDERGSLSLSLHLVAFAGNKFTANSASNTPNTFCQLFTMWATPREKEICLPIRSHKHARPALKLYTCLCVLCVCLPLMLWRYTGAYGTWANWSFAQSANLCHSCVRRTIINWNVN